MMGIKENGLYPYLLHHKNLGLQDKVFEKEYKKGEEVYGSSKRYTPIFEVVSGAVKLSSIALTGVSVMHEIVEAGEFFGNLRLLENNPGPFRSSMGQHKPFAECSKALVPAVIRCYDYAFFKHLMINDPKVSEWFYAKIVARWSKTESLFICILSMPPRQRILHVYQLYQTNIVSTTQKETTLNKCISYQELADLTATSRQLVAQTLQAVVTEISFSK